MFKYAANSVVRNNEVRSSDRHGSGDPQRAPGTGRFGYGYGSASDFSLDPRVPVWTRVNCVPQTPKNLVAHWTHPERLMKAAGTPKSDPRLNSSLRKLVASCAGRGSPHRPVPAPVPVHVGTGFGGYGYGSTRRDPWETRADH
ncbi:hypothetical protein B0H12DRAFT_1310450 [Mycena haematopus]|nr:hypothetical protein B0H12DRAFT_1310450 [Mycena haematopus]